MHRAWGMVSIVVLLWGGQASRAQSIRAQISGRQAEVGETLSLSITLVNAPGPVTPTAPPTADFDIRLRTPQPRENRQISIVNGRRTDRVEFRYEYEIRPLRIGRLTLPAFTVDLGGRRQRTNPIAIESVKGAVGPFVVCRIEASDSSIYLGQSLDLTMELWVRQFRQGRIKLRPEDLWRGRLVLSQCALGVFADADFSRPKYREARRADEDGDLHDFFVFILELTVNPTHAGELDLGSIEMVYDYPIELVQSPGMGFFGERWAVGRSRVLHVSPEIPRIEVKPIPTAGRPPDFNGAIGAYKIKATATPTEVAVGDPVTLTLTIRGRGPLERLSSPRLESVEALTRDYEVPTESLAGEVRAGAKVFTLTIRPLREDVTEVPAIPMSSFDPDTGEFRTARSRPIPLTVQPAERLVMPAEGGGGGGGGGRVARLAPLAENTEGLLANYADPDQVLSDQAGTVDVRVWLLLGVMPPVYFCTWLVRRRAIRLRHDEALRRRSRAYTRARRAFRRDGGADGAEWIAGVLLGYLADRCNVPSGGLTRADAARLLVERCVPEETRTAVDQLLASVEAVRYGGGAGGGNDLASMARRLLDDLERLRLT